MAEPFQYKKKKRTKPPAYPGFKTWADVEAYNQALDEQDEKQAKDKYEAKNPYIHPDDITLPNPRRYSSQDKLDNYLMREAYNRAVSPQATAQDTANVQTYAKIQNNKLLFDEFDRDIQAKKRQKKTDEDAQKTLEVDYNTKRDLWLTDPSVVNNDALYKAGVKSGERVDFLNKPEDLKTKKLIAKEKKKLTKATNTELFDKALEKYLDDPSDVNEKEFRKRAEISGVNADDTIMSKKEEVKTSMEEEYAVLIKKLITEDQELTAQDTARVRLLSTLLGETLPPGFEEKPPITDTRIREYIDPDTDETMYFQIHTNPDGTEYEVQLKYKELIAVLKESRDSGKDAQMLPGDYELKTEKKSLKKNNKNNPYAKP